MTIKKQSSLSHFQTIKIEYEYEFIKQIVATDNLKEMSQEDLNEFHDYYNKRTPEEKYKIFIDSVVCAYRFDPLWCDFFIKDLKLQHGYMAFDQDGKEEILFPWRNMMEENMFPALDYMIKNTQLDMDLVKSILDMFTKENILWTSQPVLTFLEKYNSFLDEEDRRKILKNTCDHSALSISELKSEEKFKFLNLKEQKSVEYLLDYFQDEVYLWAKYAYKNDKLSISDKEFEKFCQSLSDFLNLTEGLDRKTIDSVFKKNEKMFELFYNIHRSKIAVQYGNSQLKIEIGPLQEKLMTLYDIRDDNKKLLFQALVQFQKAFHKEDKVAQKAIQTNFLLNVNLKEQEKAIPKIKI